MTILPFFLLNNKLGSRILTMILDPSNCHQLISCLHKNINSSIKMRLCNKKLQNRSLVHLRYFGPKLLTHEFTRSSNCLLEKGVLSFQLFYKHIKTKKLLFNIDEALVK